MQLIYTFDFEKTEDILEILAINLRKRRLEKGISRSTLSDLSGVPAPTIAKFETEHSISLSSFVALAKALNYSDQIKEIMNEPRFNTMEELEEIRRNKNRKKGSKLKPPKTPKL